MPHGVGGCYALHSTVEHPPMTNQDIWAILGNFGQKVGQLF
jgi:uncharacterized protein YneF (UPF0154 family)